MSRPHVVAIIHARGGSKRIPLKNLKPVGGKPLIAWCIEACRGSLIDRVIVSTDHDGIADVARAAGADVPFKRPADISEDVASELVTQHGIAFHEKETGRTVDIAITIQPTTPFFRKEDVDGCVSLLENPKLDSSFTVCPIQQRPEWMYRRAQDGMLTNYLGTLIQGDAGVSQSLEPLYRPNGAVYATRRSALFDANLILGKQPGGWVMSLLRSIDIDEPIDLIVADAVAAELANDPTL